MAYLFKKNNLHKGDKVRIESKPLPPMAMAGALLLLFVCVSIYLRTRNRKSAEQLLDNILKNKSAEEIEREIERECEIDVEIATKTDEREDMLKVGVQNLARAYSENEPDYDSITLKEPNPEYNPWK